MPSYHFSPQFIQNTYQKQNQAGSKSQGTFAVRKLAGTAREVSQG